MSSNVLRSVSGLPVDSALRRFRHQSEEQILLLVESPSRCSYAKTLMWLGPLLWGLMAVYVVVAAALTAVSVNWLIFGLGMVAGLASLAYGGWQYVNVDAQGQGVTLVFDGVVRKAAGAIWTRESFDALVYTREFVLPILVEGCLTTDSVALAVEWQLPLRVSKPGALQDAKAVAALEQALSSGFTALSKELVGQASYDDVRRGVLRLPDLTQEAARFSELPVEFTGTPGFKVFPPRELAEKEAKEQAAAKAEQQRIERLAHDLEQAIKAARTTMTMNQILAEIETADLPPAVIADLRGTAEARREHLLELEERAAQAQAAAQAAQAAAARQHEAGEAREGVAGFIRRYHDSEAELDEAAALHAKNPVKFQIHVYAERMRLAARQVEVQEAAVAKGISLGQAPDIPALGLTENGVPRLTAGQAEDNGQADEDEMAGVPQPT